MITVVVTVYNTGKYLKKCMDALLAQTYRDFEIIIVDDGSTDDSGAICDSFASIERVRVIHKENGGPSSAKNAGLDAADGAYIIFPDPDDWVEENYLQLFVDRMQEYPDALICTGYFITYDHGEKSFNKTRNVEVYDREAALEQLMRGKGYNGFVWNKLLDVNLLRKNGIRFDLELGMGQDLHLLVQYFQLFDRVVYDKTETYHYYQQGGGVTTAGLTPRRVSGLKTYEKIAAMTEQEHPVVAEMARCTLVNLSMALIEKYYAGKNDPEILQTLIGNIRTYRKAFLRSRNHSVFRKIEMLIAGADPHAYYVLRKLLKRG